jgi:ABC-2 type transport system ATP-binding protein
MLEVSHIDRSFGSRQVLTDVSFTVPPGKLTGFVGGNGAGKTTTMRIILGVLSADFGTVTLNGARLTEDSRRIFGYMPEERGLYPKMRVREQVVYLARLHGLSAPEATRNATDLLERLGLGQRLDDTVESLSLGNQQRAQIAAALAHDPEVLVLDEPFSGLDPIAVEVVLGVLKERAAAGVPVLFSSHQLDIVERLCDEVVVIADGVIRAAGPSDRLREEYGSNLTELVVDGDAGWLREMPGISVVDFDGGYALFEAADEPARQRVLQRAVAQGGVLGFTKQRPTLAEIFTEVVR